MLFAPVKKLGQNFLTDSALAAELVDYLSPFSGDVVEVGSGLGILTQPLAERLSGTGNTLFAVELDERFVAKLSSMFLNHLHVKVVPADILAWLNNFEADKSFDVIGSLPYYITSPILHALVKMRERPTKCVLLMQKEVAEKIACKAPDASYISSFVQTFFDVEYLKTISKEMFSPQPQVDGGVIRFHIKDSSISFENLRKYEGFLHKGFANPRKMLNKAFTEAELQKVGVQGDLRPQNLDASDWVTMFKVLQN